MPLPRYALRATRPIIQPRLPGDRSGLPPGQNQLLISFFFFPTLEIPGVLYPLLTSLMRSSWITPASVGSVSGVLTRRHTRDLPW